MGNATVTERVYACSSYNANGKHKCFRNVIHEKPMLDYLIGQIQRLLAPENFERLRAELRPGLPFRRSAGGTDDAKRLRSRITKIDGEIEDAVEELRRTPDDLSARRGRDSGNYGPAGNVWRPTWRRSSRQKNQTGDIDADETKALEAIGTLPGPARRRQSRVGSGGARWPGLRTDRPLVRGPSFKKMTRSFFKG